VVDANPAFPEIKELFEEHGMSNPDLANELLMSAEVGYRGAFWDKRLRLAVDGYVGLDRNRIGFTSQILFDSFGRIDMQNSQLGFENLAKDRGMLGASLNGELDALDVLTLFARAELRHDWFTGDAQSGLPSFKVLAGSPTLFSGGATLRLPFGLTSQVAFVYRGRDRSELRDPKSMLSPVVSVSQPALGYWLVALTYPLRLDRLGVDLGLNLFNPLGGRFRETAGAFNPMGENYGAEILSPRVMATARVRFE
jgi:hypothetical protein